MSALLFLLIAGCGDGGSRLAALLALGEVHGCGLE